MYFELVPRRSPRKLMRYYCTYFDHKYLPRGLALYHSLRQHSGPFRLWVLCLSNECHEILAKLALPDLEMISLNEFEQGDAPLLEAKQNRSFIEYYFTCTPSLPLFIFKKFAEVDAVSYLDGDLFFFADPEIVHAEIGDHSIAITPHRFPTRSATASDTAFSMSAGSLFGGTSTRSPACLGGASAAWSGATIGGSQLDSRTRSIWTSGRSYSKT